MSTKKTTKKPAAKKSASKKKATTGARVYPRTNHAPVLDLSDDTEATERLEVDEAPAPKKKATGAKKSKRSKAIEEAVEEALELDTTEDDELSERAQALTALDRACRDAVEILANEYAQDLADDESPRCGIGYDEPDESEVYRTTIVMRVDLTDAELTARAKSAAVAATSLARLSTLQADLGGRIKKLSRSYEARVASLLKEVDSGHGHVPIMTVQQITADGKLVEMFRCDTGAKYDQRPATKEEQQAKLPGVR